MPTPPSLYDDGGYDGWVKLELEPNHSQPADPVKTALVGASLAEIRKIREANADQFKDLVNFDINLESLEAQKSKHWLFPLCLQKIVALYLWDLSAQTR